MRNLNRWMGIWLLAAVVLAGCQTVPRVPEVLGTVKVKMFGGGGAVAVNRQTGYVYIAGSQHITILKDTEIIGEVETRGEAAISMTVDETKDLVYVANEYSDNVTVIHGTEFAGIVPTVGKQPTSVAVDPRSGFAYVVSAYRSRPLGAEPLEGNILVLNGTQVVKNFKLGQALPWWVVADPVGGYVYAGGLGGDLVVFKGLEEVARHDLKPAITAITVNSQTGEVYVLARSSLYRFKEGKLIDSVRLENNPLPVWNMAVHPITGDVYIPYGGSVRREGRVLILRNMKEIGDVKVGAGPVALAIDPLTGNVYIASSDADTVAVINGTKVLATIEVGWYPHGVGINPKNGWVYVSNINDGTVTVLGYPQKNGETKTPTPIPPKTFVPNKPYP